MNDFFGALTVIELQVLDFINVNLSNPLFNTLMPFVSRICDHGEIWIITAIIMICFPKTRRAGISVAFALIMGLLIGNIMLKPLVARIRPFEFARVSLLISAPTDYSFPSGHTLASFGSAFTIFKNYRQVGVFVIIFASIIAFSRLYLYVHYPTDIFASIMLGYVFAVVATKLTKILFKNNYA